MIRGLTYRNPSNSRYRINCNLSSLNCKRTKTDLCVYACGVCRLRNFFILVDRVFEVIRMLERIALKANVNLIYVETILKIIGIAYIAEFGAQITKDAGQGAIASKIELAGKILILAMAVPILTVIIETIVNLIPS